MVSVEIAEGSFKGGAEALVQEFELGNGNVLLFYVLSILESFASLN